MNARAVEHGDWQRRWRQLVKAIVRVNSAQGEHQLLDWLMRPGEPLVLGFINAHAMNSAAVSQKFFDAVGSADVLVRDGVGMAILLRLLNQSPGRNLNGTDLIPKILARCAGGSIAFFGTRDPYLSKAQHVVTKQIAPGSSCVTAHGFLETAAYVRIAAMHRPGVIVLGMGMPRQEEVAMTLRAALGYPCLIVCGGAIIDFLGKKKPRAPSFLRRAGLEWAVRLALEPRRLFMRYVIGNPVFLLRALDFAIRSRNEVRTALRLEAGDYANHQ